MTSWEPVMDVTRVTSYLGALRCMMTDCHLHESWQRVSTGISSQRTCFCAQSAPMRLIPIGPCRWGIYKWGWLISAQLWTNTPLSSCMAVRGHLMMSRLLNMPRQKPYLPGMQSFTANCCPWLSVGVCPVHLRLLLLRFQGCCLGSLGMLLDYWWLIIDYWLFLTRNVECISSVYLGRHECISSVYLGRHECHHIDSQSPLVWKCRGRI